VHLCDGLRAPAEDVRVQRAQVAKRELVLAEQRLDATDVK
jgi:hypothetical protein